MVEKKYYWLKLKSDFFDDDTIKYIEEQENGIKYSNFYLKLCLKSLKTDGKLIRLVGETLIPYDINSLSKLTGVDFDTVRSAMQLFENIGLIKILESGEIYLSQINELIGSETDKAQIMRRIRAERKLNGNIVTKMLPYIEKDIDIEKEKELDEEKAKDNFQEVIDFYNNNIGQLTPYTMTILESYMDQIETDCIILAMQKAVESNKRNMQYIKGILNNWVKAGIKTLVEAKDEEIAFKNKKTTKEETFEEKVARYKKEWEEENEN
jgi:predicted phage replisome organizer